MSMRVAYILERMTTGWLSYELDALGKLGVDVEIHPVNPALYGEFAGAPRCQGRSLGRDVPGSFPVFIAHPVAAARILMRLVPYAGLKIAFATLATARLVGKTRPALLHAHFASAPAAAAWAVSRLTGVPYGFSAHAYDLFKEPVDRGFLTKKCADAAFVRCISEYNRRFLIETTGVDESRFHVIHCGVDTDYFAPPASRREEPPRTKTILTVANLVEQKGIGYLLDALDDPGFRKIGYRLLVIGDGPLRGELVARARRLGLPVELLGPVENSEIRRHYQRADLFVLPCVTLSDGHRDGIPVVLMEAMACGVPVISTDVSGIPELVEDGRCGILVPERDARALGGAIRRLLSDDGLARTFSIEGRRRVIERFEIRDTAERLRALFGSCARGEDR
jgi:colanic acid/amylovoran biosynthesis glycosyltransferase